MLSKRLFPCALAVCCSLVFAAAALGQNGDTRSRIVARTLESADLAIHNEDSVIEFASPEELRSPQPRAEKRLEGLSFKQLMQNAIDARLGSPYHWGSTGPNVFDCSGFVWSTFQSAGINFERASARSLWSQFVAPPSSEQYKFGTLVFFSNLKHVGIVADEHGFYHASRHHGVVYSPFNDYWLSRIDGFRRVPLPVTAVTD